MAASRNDPGSLGEIAFTALGTATSARYAPRDGSDKVYIIAWADRAGTFQYFLEDLAGNSVAFAAATAVAANTLDSAEIQFPLAGIARVYAVFTDTSNNTGTVRFYCHDNA